MAKKAAEAKPNALLRAARLQRGWTQQEVADRIEAPLALNVTRWERGTAAPSLHYIQRLCQLFESTPQELGLLTEEQSPEAIALSPSSMLWNVPYRRNPYFTGRDEVLMQLHQQLNMTHVAALNQSYAISGLGGIGKTQIAVEYTYRYQRAYQAIFWLRAANRDTLIADYVALAKLVDLPGCDAADQGQVVAAAKRWLTNHQGWLLILDNADDLSLVSDFLPTGNNGCLLLTTRAQATGKIAPGILIEKMVLEESCLLLLRRTRQMALNAEQEKTSEEALSLARAIVSELDGLPLALDQAGAYIEETGCSLEDYLKLCRSRRSQLLQWHSELSSEYPYTVASTWSLAFERIEKSKPAAAELLSLCAFLDADAIPEALFAESAAVLGPVLSRVAADPFLLNEALYELRRYSLVRRHPETKTLSIHRLVQSVIKDRMSEESRRQQAERTVRAVNAALPDLIPGTQCQFAVWPHYQQMLSHANRCVELIEHYHLAFPEAGRLLTNIGWYQFDRGRYGQAEKLLQQGLSMREQIAGPEHLDIAASLDILGYQYTIRGKYKEAGVLLQRSLAIREHLQGLEHPDIAVTVCNLGLLYLLQSSYEQAEALLQRALTIGEQGTENLVTAETLSHMAHLKYLQGQYEASEALVTRSLTIVERMLGPEHPDTGAMLGNLAYLSRFQGKYEKSEALHQRALHILERTLGPEHSNTAFCLDSLASLYQIQGKYEQARSLYQRALAVREEAWGPEHTETAGTLDNLGLVCRAQGDYAQAESLHQRALAVREQALGPEHPDTIETLNHLAALYHLQQRYAQAEALYQRVLSTRRRLLGEDHPETARTLYGLGRLYHTQGQFEQASLLYQEALSAWEQKLGAEHPDTMKAHEALQRAQQGMSPDAD